MCVCVGGGGEGGCAGTLTSYKLSIKPQEVGNYISHPVSADS